MGQKTKANGRPGLKIEAHGTDDIARVEILRHRAGENAFKIVFKFEPNKPDFQWSGSDRQGGPGSTYYARLVQKKPVRNRVAMAWSSPIWLVDE